MRKSYLFIYNDTVGTREEVLQVINKMSYVVWWRYDMPNVFYLVSDYSANQLTEQFEGIMGIKGKYIFSEYSQSAQGRLTDDSWFLLNNKYNRNDE